MACDYSRADWDSFCDHLRDVPYEDTLNSVLLLPINVMSGFMLELMYISLIVNISSSLTHLLGLQLIVLLPKLKEMPFIGNTNRINFLNLK